ncbi:hypothetical protein [Xenorhabdus sp. KJ12.1]|uniref:hypothetical protein n=1 Tax=Xenorhabdus sp. KJ12.1 TaxID=1851571 RepID=UPI000C03F1AF|nr:hypothetical protein [Xenorhabdus sp. KJ12.1]PHM70274.1 hypothetical protein Xekj_01901 [Xenorhabdus sp. KJ12.1]
MHKDTMDYNDTSEAYDYFTVEGNIIFLDVATPNKDNISVNIININTGEGIHDARLAYGINEVIGAKLLSVLELAFFYNKKVRVIGYGSDREKSIQSVIIYK